MRPAPTAFRSLLAAATPLVVLLPGAGPAAAQSLAPLPAGRLELTEILGRPDTLQPSAMVANLDGEAQVAGWTFWQMESIIYIETMVGWYWTPDTPMDVFEVSSTLYFNDNYQIPAEISDDGVVVGTDTFTNSLQVFPFKWTAANGFDFLRTPQPNGVGGCRAVSAGAEVIGGFVQDGTFTSQRAAIWEGNQLTILGPSGMHSTVRDLSADGSVAVGELGADLTSAQAIRWLEGAPDVLDAIPGATESTALFVSSDGALALGTATVGGVDLLARWDAEGAGTTFAPPMGLGVRELNAVNPAGTAAVGALSDGQDWSPFLWRAGKGFTILGELGREEDYDLSEAVDVSDDGLSVVGNLRSSVVFNGDPPTIAFLWRPSTGTVSLDAVLVRAGQQPRGLYDAIAISGDGTRIVATGTVRPTQKDTSAVLLDLRRTGDPLVRIGR